MSQQDNDAVVERFRPTSGRFSGILGLVAAAVILGLAIVAGGTGLPLGVAIGAVLGALLVWAALLRPAMWVTRRDLVMRGMFHTDRIPLAAIDRVVVTQVFAVRAGDRRFVSPTIGYTVRQTASAKLRATGASPKKQPSAVDTPQIFVEERVLHLAQTNRDLLGVATGSPEQQAVAADVRRTYAWPELAGVAVCVVALVAWAVLR